jgi:excisionase family DNA binding protein
MTEKRKDYTVSEAAEELGYAPRTIVNWIRNGKMLARKPGRDYRIPPEEVERIKNTFYSPDTEQLP